MIEPGDIATLVRELEAQGWKVEKTSHSHHKAFPPDPKSGVVHFKRSGTPSSWKNTLAELRRAGFREDEVGKKRQGNGSRVHPMIRCPACGECTFSVDFGACEGKCNGPIAESLMVSAALDVFRNAQRPTLETAFRNLLDAKELRELAIEELNRASAAAEEARLVYVEKTARTHDAGRAVDQLTEELAKRKKEFDEQVGVG